MSKAILILGSDLGDRKTNLESACQLLEGKAGRIVMKSHIYETEPWGFEHDQYFLNQAIEIETELEPHQLLDQIHQIENVLGRSRGKVQYAPRTMDIDILFSDDLILNTPELIIPHPQMEKRRFVLEPLAEIVPQYIHPVFKKTVKELLSQCADKKKVVRKEQ